MSDAPRFAEMISKIAHELRSPLTSVKGFSSTLLRRWDRFTDEQKLQFVETIHADAERMGRIVAEVLDLARLESGRFELHATTTNLRAVTAEAADGVSRLPGSERVAIEVSEDATVWADPERLGHVLGNLLENAIKFSDDGPISVSTRSGSHGTLEVVVSDRGVGIEEERLPHIFSGPAPVAQRAGPSGTGLGLYLTKRIVEAHGGSITVESAPDRGSTFVVALPTEGPEIE